ncbi:MAG TPA: lysophospholipid acyltransferase family protein [Spirochaetota bacterium]|jgi:1-acyl-sn-glycerol-3-phosphate acyltransferase|nr:MAG: 1-acyl-sn-glycerol-3-phosphate acyltransferase [Spirochaetes bacterium ADurb.Bin133]HNZ28200.1 lysophospholipid acyltransferase family protein [Spirochaetota bacterium]HPY86610.1 lysophospholipid acyltransferase family protein [Spirochaetota bacterium]
MILINLIFSFISGMLVLFMSLIFVLIDWWLLFIPRNKRYLVARKFLVVPWTIIANNFLFCMRLKVLGKEHLSKEKNSLFICNHQSWADIPAFLRYTPSTALSKSEVRRIPVVGILTIYAGGIFFDRDDKKSRIGIIKEVMEFLKQGYSMCYYPEGTRSVDGELLEPNLTLVKLAYKLKVPVIPSAIEGSRNVIQRGRIYYKFFQRVILKYSEPLYPTDFSSEEEFANACWSKVVDIHKEIKRDYFQSN